MHWAAPFEQFRKEVPDPLRFLLKEVPLYRNWYRVRLGWTFNDRIHTALQKDPAWEHPDRSLNAQNDAHRAYFTDYVIAELGDKADELLDRVLPTYPPFGKRMLMDNGWYRMLRNPKVELVDEHVAEIAGNSLRTRDGVEYEADTLLLATGFDVLNFITTYEAIGRSGASLSERWEDDNAKAYLGTVIPDFPNFLPLWPQSPARSWRKPHFRGRNAGSIHNGCNPKDARQNVGAVEIRQDVHDGYNEDVDNAHEKMVWTHPGMTSYYRNERGRIVVNSPWRNVDFYQMTREALLEEYVTESAGELIAD